MVVSALPATLRQTLQSSLVQAWRKRGLVATLLLPASVVYVVLAQTRRLLYLCGLLKIQRVQAIVIVVGNVVAGGAGKTPTVMALVQHLQLQNQRVGVISRGYGRTGTSCTEVLPTSHPNDVGDEPLLIQRSTQVPVFVADTRHAAATALLARYPDTQILLCDDGLQHYALYRDLEICVFDDRGCGNGWPLPSGPLREWWPRRPVPTAGQDNGKLLVLHTGSQSAFSGYTVQKSLSPLARSQDGSMTPLASLYIDGGKPLMAVAAIAQPESFFAMLRACQVPLAHTVALPDHYQFDSDLSNKYGGYRVICTEKDAAKLWPIATDAVSVALVFTPEPAFFQAVDGQLAEIFNTKLSSENGHKTT